jgi:hypothetical protein
LQRDHDDAIGFDPIDSIVMEEFSKAPSGAARGVLFCSNGDHDGDRLPAEASRRSEQESLPSIGREARPDRSCGLSTEVAPPNGAVSNVAA